MDEQVQIKELEKQIDALKKTVSELQKRTIKIETNARKLTRLKNEILAEVMPEEVITPTRLSELRKNITIITNDIFELKYHYGRKSFKKMDSVIFGFCDTERRLSQYLAIYRDVCVFMVVQYHNNKAVTEFEV